MNTDGAAARHFSLTACASTDHVDDAASNFAAFEDAVRRRVAEFGGSCRITIATLDAHDESHGLRHYELELSQACSLAKVSFAIDAAALECHVGVPSGTIEAVDVGVVEISPEVADACHSA